MEYPETISPEKYYIYFIKDLKTVQGKNAF